MRTVTGTLDTAENSLNRSPVRRVTVRDTRLRFASYTNQTNPVGANDDTTFSEQITTPSGFILRVITDGTTIYRNRATPTTPSTYATWTNLSIANDASCQPGLVINSTDIYMFYIASGVLYQVKSTDDGLTYGSLVNTGISITGPANIAPVSKDEVFIYSRVGTGAGAYYKVTRAFNSAGWTTTTMPRRVFGDPTAGTDWLNNGYLHFDAQKLGSNSVIVYSNRYYGLSYVTTYNNGLYSDPQLLLPNDYTKFYIGHLSQIQNRLWLTGRILRNNSDAYSPDFDCYIYSDDGVNWTALARDSYLCTPTTTLQGKIHLAGSFVYYSGASNVYQAPSSYLIDPAGDPSGMKMVIGDQGGGQYDDFIAASIEYPAAGTAPQMDIDLASADDAYFPGNTAGFDKSTITKIGSDVVLEAGYLTSAQPVTGETVTLFRGNIDQVTLDIADGQRDAKISTRDALYKHMRDYVSPFAWDIGSQLKSYDNMNNLNNFAIQTGTWVSLGPNIATTNPGFETGISPWVNYSTGTAAGTRTISTDDFNSGLASYVLEKTGGADADKWGTYYTISAVAGITYTVGLQVHCSAITGGTGANPLQYTLEAAGNYGLAGAAASVTATMTDTLSFWTGMNLTFTAQVTASVNIYFYFSNATTGIIAIDDLLVQNTSPYYATFKFDFKTQEGILFSTQPPMLDFDIGMRATDVNVSAPAGLLGIGLVGLATDSNNFILLQLSRSGGSTYLKLYKCRGGSYTSLASYTVSGSDVISNTAYDIRLVHRGGQFWGFVKAASSTSWGAAKINYVWSGTDGALCNSADGTGKVGIRAAIRPNYFHAYGIDAYSDVICLRANRDANFAAFTTSGDVLWESEKITYTAKTSIDTLPPKPVFIDSNESSWQACGKDSTSYQCRFSGGGLNWDSWIQLGGIVSPAAHQFGGAGSPYGSYGIVFIKAAEPYAAWKITETVVDLNAVAGEVEIKTDNTAHSNTNNIISGKPNDHVWLPGGNWTMTCQIAPALLNCSRGQAGTAAVKHPDNSLVFQFPDDQIQISSFTIFDTAVDYSHELILRRVAAMSGIMSCGFDTREWSSTYTISSPAVWGSLTLTDWNNAAFAGMGDFDISFDIAALGDTEGFGVMWRGHICSSITYNNATGYSAEYSFGSPDSGFSGNETHVLPIQPPAGQSLHIRFVSAKVSGTMYINGMLASNFPQVLPAAGPDTIQLWGKGASISFTNLHVPDLLSWREWAIINSGEDAKSNLTSIIGDRPIYMVSQSGATLKFSSFDRRSNLGTFTDTFYSDSYSPDDSEIASWYRVETENIIETVNPTLAAKYGLLHRHLAMNQASTPEAALMMDRLIRRSQESSDARSQSMPANLTFEIEDKFTANITASGSGLVVPQAGNQALIVNDIGYNLGLALFEMKVGARKFIS